MYDHPTARRPWLPRLAGWVFVSLLLIAAIATIAPHQLGVVIYKLALVTLGAVLGYYIDRALFPYARPHKMAATSPEVDRNAHWAQSLAMLRRAIVVLACILGLTQGL